MSTHRFKVLFLLCFVSILSFSQSKIQITGIVRSSEGQPLGGATIMKSGSTDVLATADDGGFSMSVYPDDELIFSSIGHLPVTIEVRGRRRLLVELPVSTFQLQEVEVVAELKDKILPDPTDLEVEGDYLHLRTRFRIPGGMLSSNKRLIIQPIIRNLSRRHATYMRPVVCEGKIFSISKERLFNFQSDGDPLNPYLIPYDSIKGNLLSYHDSLRLDNPDNDYRSDILFHISFNQRTAFEDSMSIARGMVNPLRFVDFGDIARWSDSLMAPKPAPVFRQEKGEINLQFAVGDHKIDPTYGDNATEIGGFREMLASVDGRQDYQMESFELEVTASPDGNSTQNWNLLLKRTKEAEALVRSSLSESTAKSIYLQSNSQIIPWDTVCARLDADSVAEVSELRKLIKQNGGRSDAIWTKIRNTPLGLRLREDYLPSLRSVQYRFTYSNLRELADFELEKAYLEDPLSMSANEWWRLIRLILKTRPDRTEEITTLFSRAMKMYPDEIGLANDYAVWLLKQNKGDTKVLQRWMDEKAPVPTLINQTLLLIREGNLNHATRLCGYLEEGENTAGIRAMLALKKRKYDEALRIMGMLEGNMVNKMALLLMMKRNEEAFRLATAYKESDPRVYYLRAMAANRMDNLNEAVIYLTEAVRLDPELLEVAKVDADMMDLVDSILL